MNRSQFEIDAEMQLKVIDTALELNKLFLQAAALGLGVHLNERREMSASGIEIVTVHPQVFRYVKINADEMEITLEVERAGQQIIEAFAGMANAGE